VLLGIAPDSSPEEVEKAYRKSVLAWHPDKSPSPDATEIFHSIQRAAKVLRNPQLRRLYDLERQAYRHQRGIEDRPRTQPREADRRPQPHERMPPPPPWLAPMIKLHFDAVHIALQAPMRRARVSAFLYGCAFTAAIGAAAVGDLRLVALAIVLYAIGRVLKTPPHEGVMSWAKLAPARRLAEFHLLDQKAARYERFSIPYTSLRVAVVQRRADYQIEIAGFPRTSVPVLFRTASKAEATRLAREASDYFQLPLAA
jgi:hypothetical protein